MIYFIGRIPSGFYKKKLIWNKAEEKLLKYQIFLKIMKDSELILDLKIIVL